MKLYYHVIAICTRLLSFSEVLSPRSFHMHPVSPSVIHILLLILVRALRKLILYYFYRSENGSSAGLTFFLKVSYYDFHCNKVFMSREC